jgi:hypothetical protein
LAKKTHAGRELLSATFVCNSSYLDYITTHPIRRHEPHYQPFHRIRGRAAFGLPHANRARRLSWFRLCERTASERRCRSYMSGFAARACYTPCAPAHRLNVPIPDNLATQTTKSS